MRATGVLKMSTETSSGIQTRRSLLARVRDPDDATSWREFDRLYRGLVFGVARRRGLEEADAQDVAQETMLSVARTMPGFDYRPEQCSFKSWLRHLTEARIADHFRRRRPADRQRASGGLGDGGAQAIGGFADPRRSDLERIWDEEWDHLVMELALQRLRQVAKPLAYQAFYLYVIKDRPAGEVARVLGLTVGRVYLTRFRLRGVFARCLGQARIEAELKESASPEHAAHGVVR